MLWDGRYTFKMSKDRIDKLSSEDEVWLFRAEAHILGLMHAYYGLGEFARSKSDLDHLQRLIDDDLVTAKHLLEAQCIGVVLGNLFVAKSSMRWRRVVNEFGDMIALHSDVICVTLYSLTMILKRLEGGSRINLSALYEDLVTSLDIENEEI